MSRITYEEVDSSYKKAEESFKKYGTNSVGESSADREMARMVKLRALLDTGVDCKWYDNGLVIVDDKFIVSLASNKWRVQGRNTWYMHKNDLQHFVDNYVRKDRNA